MDDEIDDEEMFTKNPGDRSQEPAPLDSVELPAHVPSPPSTHGWPSPAVPSVPLNASDGRSTYAPTPPLATNSPAPQLLPHPLPVNGSSQESQHDRRLPAQDVSTVESQQRHEVPTYVVMSDAERPQAITTKGELGSQPNNYYAVELKTKDEALERLRLDAEADRVNLTNEIEKLKQQLHSVTLNAEGEKTLLHKKIDTTTAVLTKARAEFDVMLKEKDMMVARMKEDVEGKEHNIEERDATILELKRELEAEKDKEIPQPTAAEIIPDIDPWYAGSLGRYVQMLRNEASATEIDDKIKAFRSFWKAESSIRGIDYDEVPPQVPSAKLPMAHQHEKLEQITPRPSVSNIPSANWTDRQDLNIHVPQQSPAEEDYSYSPGGRPILERRATLASAENASAQGQFSTSSQSTTILTPTSSVDDDSNKTPIQSPQEEHSIPQYKAYVPAAIHTSVPAPLVHRPNMSITTLSSISSPSVSNKGPDEIFFGAGAPTPAASRSRPTSRDSTVADVPAPLSFVPNRQSFNATTPRTDPNQTLKSLLPTQLKRDVTDKRSQELEAKVTSICQNMENSEARSKAWEKSASLARRKKDDARRKRQEEDEEHNDERFNSDEISYAEMKQLEDEFRRKEGELKAQEDREEYKTYVETVFDTVYESLQEGVKALMDVYAEAQNLLHNSVSGVKSLEGGDVPSVQACLALLKNLHQELERRHDAVVQAVAERDRRYKRTETQPLYAAGNIARMKSVEQHFENAEKQAALRAKREKAERVGELVNLIEDAVVGAVGIEKGESDRIVAAIKGLEVGKGDLTLLKLAHDALGCLNSSSKSHLALFNSFEIELNDVVLDAEMSQVKAEGADSARLVELEQEKAAGAKGMTDEYERRVAVLDQDMVEIGKLVKGKSGKLELSADEEKEHRLRMALDEAKRRNGEI